MVRFVTLPVQHWLAGDIFMSCRPASVSYSHSFIALCTSVVLNAPPCNSRCMCIAQALPPQCLVNRHCRTSIEGSLRTVVPALPAGDDMLLACCNDSGLVVEEMGSQTAVSQPADCLCSVCLHGCSWELCSSFRYVGQLLYRSYTVIDIVSRLLIVPLLWRWGYGLEVDCCQSVHSQG